jgi:outer membrane lipopolysaccharide assembly protein LptE/RlpB
MNTIKLKLFLLTAFALTMTGCAHNTHLANNGPARTPPVVYMQKEEIKLDSDVGKRVYAVVEESPRLTEQLRTALQKKGMVIVQDRQQAEVVFVLEGAFRAQRDDFVQVVIGLGQFAEHPEKLEARKQTWNIRWNDLVWKQTTSWAILKRYERETLDITSAQIGYKFNMFKQFFVLYGRATFQSNLDAIFKSVGLPEGSIQI